MGKKHQSESSENSSSGEVKKVKNGVSEYEKKRIERIKENKARLEALRLPSLATSLMGSVEKKNRKGKEKKGEEDDEEYKPSDGEEKASSSSEELVEEDDDDEWINESSYSSRISGCKGKSKTSLNKSTRKKKNPVQKRVEEVEYVDDDEALKKAIALSLGGSLEISCPLPRGPPQNCRVNFQLEERKEGNLVQENDKRKKRRKSSTSCVQMTKDQVIVHFFQFDEAGKGGVSVKDLRKVAIDHDFVWSDKEMADMIHLFDSDGDGKVSLDDFRKILYRCNMIPG